MVPLNGENGKDTMKRIPDPKKMKRIKGPKISRRDLDRAKVRITTHLDRDVIEEIRAIADDSGSKYQTVLNQILKDYLFGKKEGLVARIARLESAVFSGKRT
jgi:uncharacterized protein (DUF4415 family)